MDYIIQGFSEALRLILALDTEVLEVAMLSFFLASFSTFLAACLGIPFSFLISQYDFKGKGLLITVLNTLLSLPTVVIGLLVFTFISNRGPLGGLNLLFTPQGIIIGQVILALPIITTLSLNTILESEEQIIKTALSLGASKKQALFILLKEIRFGILGAVITAFGRVVGEVGISMMIGGNIRGVTRTLTTAIALETSRGEFGFALSLGIILMSLSLVINLILHSFQAGDT
ncbi:ABC transporter permease [Fuchsiella alkaliacetigena]|uniref:ABC transporter permease n=1 Tax=Fuchsiella alkaliacetigena TaxID=957042 RepID=UPI00200A98A7|nr:ABC transporter permease [Fuchsiella alkaliacetigena]MCK8825889.1 ABC transporter permease [Fuchsiella alkaliacetigena]